MTFNLCDEPWIRVRSPGGVEEVSLRDCLSRADSFSGLAGEIPSQDVAVLRLLLAIILRATRTHVVEAYDPVELWSEWWEDGLPRLAIDEYLRTWQHRFDLRHPSDPFYQVPDLSTASGKGSGLGKIIADLPYGEPFFTTRAGAQLDRLPAAEAARWLVHCHAFDPSGIKSGAVGDARVKGGKGYPMGTGWAGNLGLVVLEGSSLAETLLLNLALSPPPELDDRPAWERPPLTSAVEVGHEVPTGPADVFTWQSRRVRLFWSGADVVDVQISYGDRLDPRDRFDVEPMSGFRRSDNQSKLLGRTVMFPSTHDPGRQVWRGIAALLARVPGPAESRPPDTLNWLATLARADVLDMATTVKLRAVGLSYGTQNAVIDGAIDDSLSCRVAALVDEALIAQSIAAAAAAQHGVAALAGLAGDLARAANSEPAGPRERAWEAGFAALDHPYREWLETVGTVENPALRWRTTAYRLLLREGQRLEESAGPDALTGRNINRPGEKANHLDVGLAGRYFRAALRKALLPHHPQIHDKEVDS